VGPEGKQAICISNGCPTLPLIMFSYLLFICINLLASLEFNLVVGKPPSLENLFFCSWIHHHCLKNEMISCILLELYRNTEKYCVHMTQIDWTCTSGSYMHRAAIYSSSTKWIPLFFSFIELSDRAKFCWLHGNTDLGCYFHVVIATYVFVCCVTYLWRIFSLGAASSGYKTWTTFIWFTETLII
jgi:hypothetical protein